jgi:hypothetical protein
LILRNGQHDQPGNEHANDEGRKAVSETDAADDMHNQVSKKTTIFGLRNVNSISDWLNSIFQCLIYLPFPINKPIDLSVGEDKKEVMYRFEALRSKMLESFESFDGINSFIPPKDTGDPNEVSYCYLYLYFWFGTGDAKISTYIGPKYYS